MNRILIAACFVVISISGCSVFKPKRLSPSDVFERRSFDYPLDTGGWRLFLGVEGAIGDPIEAFTHLYAERQGELLKIESPTDFARLSGVRVSNPDEALAFVRLFTDDATYFYFHRPVAIEYPEQNAIVERAGDGFRVRRKLLYLRPRHKVFENYEVMEFISPQGQYICKRTRLIETLERLPRSVLFYQ